MHPLPTIPTQADAIVRLASLEREVEHLRRQLEHHERLATLGTLAAGVAHEINNILTPVLAYAQIAAGAPDDHATQAKAIEKIIKGVETTAQIIQAMLGFSQASSDTDAVADARETVEAALSCIARAPAKDAIVITLAIPPGTMVAISPVALQQIMINLTLNALTAMHGRAGELTFTAVPRHDGRTVIRVADNGPGIPPEVADRLFEPFVSTRGSSAVAARSGGALVQAAGGGSGGSGRGRGGAPRADGGRKSEPPAPGGSGLGLSICQRLIAQAGGAIGVSPTLGGGATFTITLPTAALARAQAS